jgi:hypothetical protein
MYLRQDIGANNGAFPNHGQGRGPDSTGACHDGSAGLLGVANHV